MRVILKSDGARLGRLNLFSSPELPAAIFLSGMIFCLAITHLLGLFWLRNTAAVLYSTLFVWVLLISWRRRESLKNTGKTDILFAMLVLDILCSAILSGDYLSEIVAKNLTYLLFMMLSPYLCGRLMREGEIGNLLKITLIMGLAILPLMFLDFLLFQVHDVGRWPFFGHDYSPLLIGCVLAVMLISLSIQTLSFSGCESKSVVIQLLRYMLIGLVAGVLVWVKARGWVVAGLVGVGVVSWMVKSRCFLVRLRFFAYVLGIIVLSLLVAPRADTSFYAQMLKRPILMQPGSIPSGSIPSDSITSESGLKVNPILGSSSCRPFALGVNSTDMRWVLYQEAHAIFMENPLFGIGATRFGERSCVGRGGFPHSTILQGFAELGLAGGVLLLSVLFSALITLVRQCVLKPSGEDEFEARFVLALFSALLLADQIYGNYFMMVGTCLMLGISARMQVENKKECAVYG